MTRARPLLAAVLLTAACGSQVRVPESEPTAVPTSDAPTSAAPTPTAKGSTTAAPSVTVSASARASGSATTSPTPPPSPGALTRDPLLLVGWWHLTTSVGATDLGLGDDGTLVHPCGRSMLGWAASPTGLFVAGSFGGDGSCYQDPPRPDLRWLESVRLFAVSQDRLVLYGADGVPVAQATREATPNGRQDYRLTPALRARLASAPQLPQGVRPVTAQELARKWLPHSPDQGNGKGYVSWAADGSWRGSDGCNGVLGRYAVGDFGEYVVTAGPVTTIACDTTPAPQWAERGRRLGIDTDGALALYDGKGRLLGRLWKS